VTIRAAIVQMRGVPFAAAENRARGLALAEEAVAAGARLVVLPELVVPGYDLDPAGLARAAEPLDGPTLAAWHAFARKTGACIAGGFCERDGAALYNTAVLVGPDGLLLHYRKLHLFDAEKLIFTPGDRGLGVVDTPVGRVGLCVCYDLRFVEVVRALALQGAEIVAVPTAWVGGFDRNPRDAMGFIGQARGAVLQANLSQVFIACASQSGRSEAFRFLGSSLVVDPYGELLVGPLDEDEEGIALADIDPAKVAAAQVRSERVRPREDRRTDVYGLTIGGRTL